MQEQANVYKFEAEPQVSHPKYRDQDLYEELTDLPEDQSKIKPDYYIDRPVCITYSQPTPEYNPLPKGGYFETQIESYEPDLFDYILEGEHVLQVLVGKSVEQARMELIEKFEREELKIQKAAFEKKRNAELMVSQRMQAAQYIRRKEERVIKRKAEIKRRRELKEKREIQGGAFYNLTLSKAKSLNSIFQANIQEVTIEIGQKGVVLHLGLFLYQQKVQIQQLEINQIKFMNRQFKLYGWIYQCINVIYLILQQINHFNKLFKKHQQNRRRFIHF